MAVYNIEPKAHKDIVDPFGLNFNQFFTRILEEKASISITFMLI